MGLSSAQRALRFHFIACEVGAELLNGLQKENAKAGIYAAYTSLNPILMLWAKYLYNYGILHDRIRLLNSDPESWEMKIYGKNREQHSLFPPVRRGGDRRHRKTEDLFRVRGQAWARPTLCWRQPIRRRKKASTWWSAMWSPTPGRIHWRCWKGWRSSHAGRWTTGGSGCGSLTWTEPWRADHS